MYANYKLEHKIPGAIIYALFLHLFYNDLEVHCLRGAASRAMLDLSEERKPNKAFF